MTTAVSRERRFRISAEDYRRAEARAAERGSALLGFYHSHPDHPARPSEFDREHALPWWSYVIVSVQQKRSTDVLSWELREDRSRFDAEEIVIHKD